MAGGFPCQGISRLNVRRKGLGDVRTALFWEVMRVIELAMEVFGGCDVRCLGENPDSGPPEDLKVISETFGRVPFRLCASQFSNVRRPRLYWLDWPLGPELTADVKECPNWVELRHQEDPGPVSRWLLPGSKWGGAEQGGRLPTFVRATRRRRPPEAPAGLSSLHPFVTMRWHGGLQTSGRPRPTSARASTSSSARAGAWRCLAQRSVRCCWGSAAITQWRACDRAS